MGCFVLALVYDSYLMQTFFVLAGGVLGVEVYHNMKSHTKDR